MTERWRWRRRGVREGGRVEERWQTDGELCGETTAERNRGRGYVRGTAISEARCCAGCCAAIGCLHSNPRWCYLLTHWFGGVNFPELPASVFLPAPKHSRKHTHFIMRSHVPRLDYGGDIMGFRQRGPALFHLRPISYPKKVRSSRARCLNREEDPRNKHGDAQTHAKSSHCRVQCGFHHI